MATICSGRNTIAVTRLNGGLELVTLENLDEVFEWVVEKLLWEAREGNGAQSYKEGMAKMNWMADTFAKTVKQYKREVGGVANIVHNGELYSVDCQSPCIPEVTFIETTPYGNSRYEVYELQGGHEGPVIHILVQNARMEPGEYGSWDVEYDGVYWTKPNQAEPMDMGILPPRSKLVEFDDLLWEVYGDKVKEQIREGYRS